MNANPLIEGRKADSARRRQRVIKAINAARRAGTAISVSGIARQAGVDRAFLYRHKDLLAQVHAAGAEPPGRRRQPCRQQGLAPGRPGEHTGPRQPSCRARQAPGEQALGTPWRAGLARVRARGPRRRRTAQEPDHQAGTTSGRPDRPA
ncbi:DUF6262 family protein [Streptomyces achromogenes]|uniref:DUF6262 family protein n=1 Tax=Streptomyces achromogenes TaxID=67255 RepID=UPI0027D90928|nr:DUF6262 family protein [Streptomyces achromogenes]